MNKAIASFIRLGWLEQNDRTYRITHATASNSTPADYNRGQTRDVIACVVTPDYIAGLTPVVTTR